MQFVLLTLFAAIGIAVGLEPPPPADLNANIQFISRDDLEKLAKNNPELIFTPLEIQQTKQQTRYTLGNRVNGDQIVGQVSNSYNWGTLQDIRITLDYPSNGQGAIVTFASVTVQQSSNLGQAYVVTGGIGYRYIKIYVEAYSTTYFSYVAQIYGI